MVKIVTGSSPAETDDSLDESTPFEDFDESPPLSRLNSRELIDTPADAIDHVAHRSTPWFCTGPIYRVTGRIVSARGLHNADTFGKSDPFCVVKGIKSNNRYVDVYKTQVKDDTLNPVWDEDFSYDVPEAAWQKQTLSGLRFMLWDWDEGVFDTTHDFLGGADLDLGNAGHNKEIPFELELRGADSAPKGTKLAIKKKKHARLMVNIRAFRRPVNFCISRGPYAASDDSPLIMRRRIRGLECNVIKARNLRDVDIGLGVSDPQCIVRVILSSGQIREVFRTQAIEDNLNPIWDESFRVGFTAHEEPIILTLEVYDTEDGFLDEHLGSALINLQDMEYDSKNGQHMEFKLTGGGDIYARRARVTEGKSSSARKSAGQVEYISQGEITTQMTVQDLGAADKKLRHSLKSKTMGLMDDVTKAAQATAQIVPQSGKKIGKNAQATIKFRLATKSVKEVCPNAELLLPSTPESLQWRPRMKGKPILQPPEKPPRAEERIAFICGTIISAHDLSNADFLGKSDPYCLIEAQMRAGGSIPVYRTRTVDNDLSPEWGEMFYLIVDLDGPDIDKLSFSVFDDDDGMFADGEDDFLGRATVDLSSLPSGVTLSEEIPMVGSKIKVPEGGKKRQKFRRGSSLRMEVRVERRVKPIPPPDEADKMAELLKGFAAKPRHEMSRKGPISRKRDAPYTDPSQDCVYRQAPRPLAGIGASMMQTALKQMVGNLATTYARSSTSCPRWIEQPAGVGRWCRDSQKNSGTDSNKTRDVMHSSFSLPELSQTSQQPQSRVQMGVNLLKQPRLTEENDRIHEHFRLLNEQWNEADLNDGMNQRWNQRFQRTFAPVFMQQRPMLRIFERY
eukprot:gnl/MRDRNA2_/MRDRNA2_126840_c0_seq1.p1 gnl/MRDRNA2_/MRDRNA2_126840_c0~~gnl/MRDRNA2_/MRDRNA2_126840_c0_seq1.p1  ORF type:complete len:848 (-),score=117.56 gnl/MRDRNA2_/MRDRNA2_126840_c0_seq1:56-2599(-)